MTRKHGIVLLLAAVFAVGACGTSASPTPVPPTAAPATGTPATAAPATPTSAPVAEKCTGQKVSFQLSFIPNVQHAGFLVAKNRGFYTDEGLDVEILPGGPTLDPTSAVGDGSVQLGQVDYAQLLRARAAGVPIVSIAQTYQKTFLNWFAYKSSGIATIQDWVGKKIGVVQIGDDPEMNAILATAGVDRNSMEFIQQGFGIDDVVAGKVDVGTGVVFFHPAMFNGTTETKWPDAFNIFTPDDLGATISSQTVATNEAFLAADPNALRCFMRASIRGWRAAFTDTETATDDVMVFIPEGAIPRPHQAAAINDVLPIIGSGASDPGIMKIDPAAYEETIDTLEEVGFFEGGTVPDLASSYTTSIFDTMGPIAP